MKHIVCLLSFVFFFFIFESSISAQSGSWKDAKRHQGIAKSGRGHCGASPRRNAISHVDYHDVKKKKHPKKTNKKKHQTKNKKKAIAKRGKK